VSRAFVKETDETFEVLPDRPISAHQNLVTLEGLELIETTLARLRQEHALAQSANDRMAQARIARDPRLDFPALNRANGSCPEGCRRGPLRLHDYNRT
jgi:hypothetical protein